MLASKVIMGQILYDRMLVFHLNHSWLMRTLSCVLLLWATVLGADVFGQEDLTIGQKRLILANRDFYQAHGISVSDYDFSNPELNDALYRALKHRDRSEDRLRAGRWLRIAGISYGGIFAVSTLFNILGYGDIGIDTSSLLGIALIGGSSFERGERFIREGKREKELMYECLERVRQLRQ